MNNRLIAILYACGLFFTVGMIALSHDRVRVDVQVKEVTLDNAEASVSLSKWQVSKMLAAFEEDDHPSETRVFNTVIKKDFEGWRLSSTHLARYPE